MNAKRYIREILERSCLPRAERKKIKLDLENEIYAAMDRGESIERIIERMGDPDDVAAGLYENFIDIPIRPFREYKSKKTLFGLPIVHIIRGNYAVSMPIVRVRGGRAVNLGGIYSLSCLYELPTARGIFAFGPKAKGIIAVGNLSAGLISIGNLSAGIISMGNLAAGLFSIGNLALAILIALGNAVAGALSAGNVAFGYATAGNLAFGKFAVGNEVKGAVTFTISNLAPQFLQIKEFFAKLDASAPVKMFFWMVEKALAALINPVALLPLIITSSTVILAIILVLIIVPNRLLKKAN